MAGSYSDDILMTKRVNATFFICSIQKWICFSILDEDYDYNETSTHEMNDSTKDRSIVMDNLFERYEVIEQKGSELTIPDYFPAIYVSENNDVYCFVGIFLNYTQRDVRLHMNPYYMHGKHSTDKKYAAEINGFFRIINGYIAIDQFIDNQYRDIKYKKINAHIRFPVAAETYFGVLINREEDERLTRAIFGLTHSELSSVLEGYAKILGTYNMYTQFPRITRSVRSINYCDITDILIPEQFPYVTFKDSGYDFSHVSLWGFYRYFQLLINDSKTSQIGKAILKADISETVMDAMLRINDYPYYLSKVTRTTFNEE